MGTQPPLLSISIIVIYFLCFPCVLTVNSQICPNVACSRDESFIRFPFRIQTRQPKQCGYPGFDVFCDGTNQTIIELPNTGNFTIQQIDYAEQEVWLNDPEHCLPNKILSLDFSGSPFTAVYYQNFSFFNCSSGYISYGLNPITCLSSSNFTVFATSSSSVYKSLSSSCHFVKTVAVPVQQPFFEQVFSSDLVDDLKLKWDTPRCGRCESRGGQCTLKANSTDEIVCTNLSRRGLPRAARYAITVGVGIPALLCLIGLVCFVCSKVKSYSRRWGSNPPDLPSTSQLATQPKTQLVPGLDGSTIESYPKIVLGESRRLPKQNHNTCPICLLEYQPQETLRTIPECNHCFHAACIGGCISTRAAPCAGTTPRPHHKVQVRAISRCFLR